MAKYLRIMLSLQIMLKLIPVIAVLLLLLIGCTSPDVNVKQNSNGKIAFLWSNDGDQNKTNIDLIMSDGNGNKARYVGYFTSTPTFSPDGNSLAVGCGPDKLRKIPFSICILDVSNFLVDGQPITPVIDSYIQTPLISKLNLPPQCRDYEYKQEGPLEGIFSIDWAPQADKLIVVCGNKIGIRDVCILPLSGEVSCWDRSASQVVSRAVWSPVDDDKILVDLLVRDDLGNQVSKIYLVSPDGKVLRYISDGFAPEWSRDGKEIAYIESVASPNRWDKGIALINVDGSNHRLLLKPPLPGFRLEYFIFRNRLAWSPDGRFMLFPGLLDGTIADFRIFRLEISTGKVDILFDPGIFRFLVAEPDWGP